MPFFLSFSCFFFNQGVLMRLVVRHGFEFQVLLPRNASRFGKKFQRVFRGGWRGFQGPNPGALEKPGDGRRSVDNEPVQRPARSEETDFNRIGAVVARRGNPIGLLLEKMRLRTVSIPLYPSSAIIHNGKTVRFLHQRREAFG